VSSCDTPKTKRKSLTYLTSSVLFVVSERAAVADSESRYKKLMRELCLVIAALLLPISNAVAATEYEAKELFKIYAHTQLMSSKQYYCIEKLWDRESRWDPTARNKKSTAYGIPQLLKLKETNPYRQIDAGLRYVAHRHSTPCQAYSFFLKRGHY
jgi:hypothetical protein